MAALPEPADVVAEALLLEDDLPTPPSEEDERVRDTRFGLACFALALALAFLVVTPVRRYSVTVVLLLVALGLLRLLSARLHTSVRGALSLTALTLAPIAVELILGSRASEPACDRSYADYICPTSQDPWDVLIWVGAAVVVAVFLLAARPVLRAVRRS